MIVLLNSFNELNRVLCRILTLESYDTVGFTEGAKAVDAMLRQPPKLLITGNQFPDTTGLEVVRLLRADAVTARLPVIFTPGTFDHIEEAMSLRVLAYVIKPFTVEQLLPAILAVFRREDADRELPDPLTPQLDWYPEIARKARELHAPGLPAKG
jgi:DNA-binding response OmpR family regulator